MTGKVRVSAHARAAAPPAASSRARAAGRSLPPSRASPTMYLRELRDDDAAALVAAARASRGLHGAWVSPPRTIEAFAARQQKRGAAGSGAALLALRRGDDAVVGMFNLSEIIRGPLQQAFLGYYGFAPHTGRGYMREGMRLLLGHAFGPLKLHRIEASVQPANERSIALVRACGFVREGFSARYLKIAGRWRDHERWAINADDWKALRRGELARP